MDIKLRDDEDCAVVEYDLCSGPDPGISLSNVFSSEKGGLKSAPSELLRFERGVNIYLEKLMGDPNDGLNASRGILSRSVYWSFYGVPLVTRAGRELLRSNKPLADSETLPKLPVTMSNPVRIIVEKYARDKRIEQLIATTALEPLQWRERTMIFGSTYYEEYIYDGLPCPREPFTPDPVLAFLHELSWAIIPRTTSYLGQRLWRFRQL